MTKAEWVAAFNATVEAPHTGFARERGVRAELFEGRIQYSHAAKGRRVRATFREAMNFFGIDDIQRLMRDRAA